MKNLKSRHNFNVIERHLSIVALMVNEHEIWNARELTDYLSNIYENEPGSGLESKTIRTDIKTHIPKTLGISFKTKQGARKTEIETEINNETLKRLLTLYAGFVIHDSAQNIALNKLINRQGKLSLWLLARVYFACLKKKKISFTYTGNDMKTRKVTMNPYHIINRSNKIFLVGKRDKDNTVGPYIFDRISDLALLDIEFDDAVPAAEEFFQNSFDAFIWNWSDATEVKIKYSLKRENNMIDEFSHLNPVVKRISDYFEMTFQVFDTDSVCRQLFYYGKDVEIISPAELREDMINMLKESMSVYLN